MFVYLLNRWTLTRRFAKVEGGYVYRRRPDLPGFLVNEQERKSLLREFRRRYWKSWFLMMACLLAGAALLSIVAVVFRLGESFVKGAAYMLIAAVLAFILWEQREWSLLPERHFKACPQIEPEMPSSGYFDRFHDMMRQRSWFGHFGMLVIYGPIAWLLTPTLPDTTVFHWFFFAIFAGCTILTIYGAIHKATSKRC